MESAVQLITVLLIFVFVLVITYYTTRWVGNFQKNRYSSRNIEILEAGRLTQNQHIQLVRVGDRYLILGVSKDHIALLGEISRDELDLTDTADGGLPVGDAFARVLSQAKNIMPHK